MKELTPKDNLLEPASYGTTEITLWVEFNFCDTWIWMEEVVIEVGFSSWVVEEVKEDLMVVDVLRVDVDCVKVSAAVSVAKVCGWDSEDKVEIGTTLL